MTLLTLVELARERLTAGVDPSPLLWEAIDELLDELIAAMPPDPPSDYERDALGPTRGL